MHRLVVLVFLMGLSVSIYADNTPRSALEMPLSSQAIFLDITSHNGNLYAVGERGIILSSKNAGETWQQIASPVDVTLTSIAFSSNDEAWIVGHESTILHSTDGGKSWAIKRYKPEEERFYMAVQFFTPEQGYILGTDGELWATKNGGDSWDLTILSVEEWYQNHLFDIAKVGQSKLVVAERGGVFYAKDNASAWQPVPSPYVGSYFGVATLNNQFLLFGMSGQMYLLHPETLVWSKINTSTDQFLLASTSGSNKQREIVVGRGGTILFIQKDGTLLKRIERKNRVDFTAVTTLEDEAYLASMSGGIEKITVNNLLQ